MRLYRTVFTREALEFVVQADDGAFEEIELWVSRIEQAPATRGDYPDWDEDSRELQVIVLRATVVTYWTDDAAREVRVVRIESLGRSKSR